MSCCGSVVQLLDDQNLMLLQQLSQTGWQLNLMLLRDGKLGTRYYQLTGRYQ